MSVNPTNPGQLFGGSWEAIAQGTFLISAGENYTVQNTYGSATHTHTTNTGTTGGTAITTAQMPAHTHTRGTMEISGTFCADPDAGWCRIYNPTGAFTADTTNKRATGGAVGSTDVSTRAVFTASRNWTGATSSVGSGSAHTHSQVSVGTSAVSNIPPSLAVYMWQRTG